MKTLIFLYNLANRWADTHLAFFSFKEGKKIQGGRKYNVLKLASYIVSTDTCMIQSFNNIVQTVNDDDARQ